MWRHTKIIPTACWERFTNSRARKRNITAHPMFLEHWNSQKILSHIRQCFSCLLDEWLKICFFHKIDLLLFACGHSIHFLGGKISMLFRNIFGSKRNLCKKDWIGDFNTADAYVIIMVFTIYQRSGNLDTFISGQGFFQKMNKTRRILVIMNSFVFCFLKNPRLHNLLSKLIDL